MKRLMAAALCAALPLAAGVAMAQQGAQVPQIGIQGDGVSAPTSGFPLAPAAGVDSGAVSRAPAGASNTGRFNSNTWKYGPRFDAPANSPLWNPVMIKLSSGQQVYSATVSGNATPEQYCTQAANPAYDFIWSEMQHSPGTWSTVAAMWNACPGTATLSPGSKSHAVPGARVSVGTEMEIQHATDMGAMIVIVPTVDTAAEAAEASKWTYFPPIGRRSSGSNVAGSAAWWQAVPGGYRQTYNRNMVLVAMIETLEGLANVDGIAKAGVTGIFAASGDLGNFTGYAQGDPDYERVINIVHDSALRNKVKLFGPSAWAARPDFNGFQGGPPSANAGRGRGGRGARGAAPAQ